METKAACCVNISTVEQWMVWSMSNIQGGSLGIQDSNLTSEWMQKSSAEDKGANKTREVRPPVEKHKRNHWKTLWLLSFGSSCFVVLLKQGSVFFWSCNLCNSSLNFVLFLYSCFFFLNQNFLSSACNQKEKKTTFIQVFLLIKGNFVSTKYNLSTGYIPSLLKKEVGSVGQRIQLAPLGSQHTSKGFLSAKRDFKMIYALTSSLIILLKKTRCFSKSWLYAAFFRNHSFPLFYFLTLTPTWFHYFPSLFQSAPPLLHLIIKKKRINLQNSNPYPTHHSMKLLKVLSHPLGN